MGINQEVFLFGTDLGADSFRSGVTKEAQDAQGLLGQCRNGAHQRNLAVQCLA